MSGKKRVRSLGFRVFLLAAGIAYLALAAVSFGGQWFLKRPTPENLSKGLRWSPGNPSLWTRYAQHLLFAPDGFQPRRAVDAFLRAAASNPLEPANWQGLATAYLQMGDHEKAEEALRAGLAAMPHSPQAAWRLANFLLLRGRRDEALPYLRIAATSDPSLRPAVFDLGWKILGEPESILHEIVPSDLKARSDYLRFLLARKKLIESYEVWREIRQSRSDEVRDLGYTYVHALAAAGLGVEADRVWKELLADTGRALVRPEGELVTNGDFEAELPNAGLDWRLASGQGQKVSLDNFVLQHGSRSLRVTFDGSSNPDFAGVWQLVPVEPNSAYRFRGYIKTENVTSNSGLRFAVATVAGPPEESFVRYTENRIGTEPWTLEQLDFRTGPNIGVVKVALRRLRSRKLNNLIGGKVWIDNLSMQKTPE